MIHAALLLLDRYEFAKVHEWWAIEAFENSVYFRIGFNKHQ